MANYFQKYLERKKKERALSPHQQRIGRVGSMLAQPYQDMSQQIEYELERSGAPLATKFDVAQQQQQQLAKILGKTYEGAVTRDIERKDILTRDISELEFKSDIFKEQEKKRKDAEDEAKEKQWWQTGLQAAGAGVGLLAGGLPGAQIGSAFGGMVGGAVTDSPEMLLQATGDILSVIGTESGLRTVEKKMSDFSAGMQDILTQYRNKGISYLEANMMLEQLKFSFIGGNLGEFRD